MPSQKEKFKHPFLNNLRALWRGRTNTNEVRGRLMERKEVGGADILKKLSGLLWYTSTPLKQNVSRR